MSVTVTTVDGRYDEPRKISFHNGFGWFLDEIFKLIGDPRAPRALFTQAVAPVEQAPGDLSPEQARAFGQLIDEHTNEQLVILGWKALNGRQAEPDMGPAVETIRAIAVLAYYSTDHGGLTFL